MPLPQGPQIKRPANGDGLARNTGVCKSMTGGPGGLCPSHRSRQRMQHMAVHQDPREEDNLSPSGLPGRAFAYGWAGKITHRFWARSQSPQSCF